MYKPDKFDIEEIMLSKLFKVPRWYVQENTRIILHGNRVRCPHGPVADWEPERMHIETIELAPVGRSDHSSHYVYAGRCNLCGKIYVRR